MACDRVHQGKPKCGVNMCQFDVEVRLHVNGNTQVLSVDANSRKAAPLVI